MSMLYKILYKNVTKNEEIKDQKMSRGKNRQSYKEGNHYLRYSRLPKGLYRLSKTHI